MSVFCGKPWLVTKVCHRPARPSYVLLGCQATVATTSSSTEADYHVWTGLRVDGFMTRAYPLWPEFRASGLERNMTKKPGCDSCTVLMPLQSRNKLNDCFNNNKEKRERSICQRSLHQIWYLDMTSPSLRLIFSHVGSTLGLFGFPERVSVTQRERGLSTLPVFFCFFSIGPWLLWTSSWHAVLVLLPSDNLNKDSSNHDLLKAELRLLPLSSEMEAFLYQRVSHKTTTWCKSESHTVISCFLQFLTTCLMTSSLLKMIIISVMEPSTIFCLYDYVCMYICMMSDFHLLHVCLQKPFARSCSLEETVSRSHTFHAIGQGTDNLPQEEGSPRQRRITVGNEVTTAILHTFI